MDGTITDSREAYLQTLLEVLERIGRPRTREEVAELIVPSIIGTVRRVLSGDEEMIQRAELMIRKLVVKRGDGIRLCPGVIGALARLEKKYMLGLLTASDRSLVDATLGRLEVLRIFNQVVTVNLELPTKDERFRHLLGLLGAEPSESVFVGDTVNDIETARRNGSLSVAVFNPCSWSWPRKEVLMDAKPDIMIESLEELPPWLGC